MDTRTDILKKIQRLMDKRCDCVISLKASTQCWRCREIQFLSETLKAMAVSEQPTDRTD